MQILLQHGVQIESKDNDGRTALSWAVQEWNTEFDRIQKIDRTMPYPLAENRRLKVVQILHDAGAEWEGHGTPWVVVPR